MPHSISSWTNLQRFLIQNNQFTGTFPNSIVSSWTILGTFRISSNQFTGTIPSALGSLSFISEIWVHDNDLTGNIDALFCSTSPTSVSIQADCGGTNPKIVCTCCTTCHWIKGREILTWEYFLTFLSLSLSLMVSFTKKKKKTTTRRTTTTHFGKKSQEHWNLTFSQCSPWTDTKIYIPVEKKYQRQHARGEQHFVWIDENF